MTQAECDASLLNQCRRWAFTLYYHMQLSGHWGDAGEQQVKLAFCRVVLQVPPEQEIHYTHVDLFYQKCEEAFLEFGLQTLNESEAKSAVESLSFSLFDRSWTTQDLEALGDKLQESGSNYVLQGGFYGSTLEFILGHGSKTQYGEYRVYYLEHELMRSPNTIMAMAAMIGHKSVYVRKESLIAIFYQKWVSLFSSGTMLNDYEDPFFRLGLAIKHYTLKLYGADTQEALIAVQDLFIEDMKETVLCHELGHGVIQHGVLPQRVATMGEAATLCGETILTALLEFLADFAPALDTLKGPIQNMIEIAKTDPLRASRMYSMYLSDTWFYDTPDAYMYGYSDLVSLVLMAYGGPEKVTNFEKLEQDIADIYLPLALQKAQAICQDLYTLLHDSLPITDPEPEAYMDATLYWSEKLEALKKQPESWEGMMTYFETTRIEFLKTWFEAVLGKETALNYNHDSRLWLKGA